MTKPLRTLFVIADGMRARWVKRSDVADDFATFKEIKAEPVSAGRRPDGGVFERSADGSSGAGELNAPVRRHNAQFAAEIAEVLNGESASGVFDRLALVAPARMLGPINKALSPMARAKVVNTLAKDLTKTPDHGLDAWLRHLEFG